MNKLLLILSLLIATTGYSQQFKKVGNPVAVKNKINSKADKTQTISASFDEVIHSSMYNKPKSGKGKLKYKKENKIRWEHVTPKKQIVLINQSSYRLYENGKEVKNAGTNQVIKKVQSMMMQLFNGQFLNGRDFNISYFENSKDYKLILKPKNKRMSKYISRIEMYFKKSDLSLRKMILLETEQDKIVYSFSSVTMNGQLSDSHFTKF